MFVLAIVLQQGLRMSSVVAGLALVPLALAVFVASMAGPRMVVRYGAGEVVMFGSLLQFVGGILLLLTLLGPLGMRNALLVTLPAWLGAVASTAVLSLGLPRSIS